MSGSRTKFYLDKQNAKWSGVCAGIADYTGFDVTLIRVGAVLLTLMTTGWIIVAYFIAAWLAPKKPIGLYDTIEDQKFWQGVRQSPARSTRDVRAKFRDVGFWSRSQSSVLPISAPSGRQSGKGCPTACSARYRPRPPRLFRPERRACRPPEGRL